MQAETKCRRTGVWTLALGLIALVGPPDRSIAAQAPQYGPTYANLHGEMLLDNARVIVQKFVIEPGQSTGRHTHPGDQLAVFIKGG
jgi:quercetin dioxygenase-like cupin family protein